MQKDIASKILELKKERNALILSHNYQIGEVQDIADFVGDSLELAIKASKTDAKVIVFCGVNFMAETAVIENPDKIVLMPDVNAGCPMADMINAKQLIEMKGKHPKAAVVAYVNTTAAVKAESDVCCTSANAGKVIESLKEDEIIFIPDKYLGLYHARTSKKKFHFWEGYCPIHVRILPEHIKKLKAEHPEAKVMVHPECLPEVIDLADAVRSTSGMVKYAQETDAKEFIVGTEVGLIYRLKKENPGKTFYPATELAVCPNMKKTNLEKILWSLEDMKEKITVPEDIRLRAKKAIDRMLAIA